MRPKVTEAGMLELICWEFHSFLVPPFGQEDQTVASLGILTGGLQVVSSWLMSVLALLALFVSVILCLIFLEVFFERRELSGAYTVKPELPNAPMQRSR